MNLPIILIVLVVISVSNGCKDSMMKKAFDHQEKIYEQLMKTLFNNNDEIEIGNIELTIKGTKGKYDLYKFVGPIVQDMPLKMVFNMLQNWYTFIEEEAKTKGIERNSNNYKGFIQKFRFFELNIGGKDFTFGIYLVVGSRAILISDTSGKALDYAPMFKLFDESGKVKEIAQKLLDSAEGSLKHQPEWKGTDFEDDALMDSMRMFSIISQVAEAARPSKEFFEIMENAFEKVKELPAFKNWGNKAVKFLEDNSYSATFSSEDTRYDEEFFYHRLFLSLEILKSQNQAIKQVKKKIKKTRNEAEINKQKEKIEDLKAEMETIKQKLSTELPMLSDNFLKNLILKKDIDKEKLSSFLKDNNFDTDAQYDITELQKSINELNSIPVSKWGGEEGLNARKNIEKYLPIKTLKFFMDFWKEAKKEFGTLRQNIKKIAVPSKKQNDKMVKIFEDGRIPGAGVFARGLLKHMSEGKISSFQDFNKMFTLSEIGGLKKARRLRREFNYETRPEEKFRQNFILDFQKSDQLIAKYNIKLKAELDGMHEELDEKLKYCCNCFFLSSVQMLSAESCGKKKLVEDSVRWEDDMLKFETVDDEGVKEFHEIKYPLDQMPTTQSFKERAACAGEVFNKVGIGLGVYGTLASAASSIEQFMNGNYGQGAFSAAQTLHSIGGLTGVNEKLQRAIVRKSLDFAAESFKFEKFTEKLSEPLAKGLGRSAKVVSCFLEDIPFVGLGFDITFITQDIKDLKNTKSSTPVILKVVHLILDIETTVLSLVGLIVPEAEPIIEPIVISLSIIRMSIDDFYTDITRELDKVKGKSFVSKVVAFSKGFAEGIADFFTLSLVNQLDSLNDAEKKDKDLFQSMSDPEKYFNKALAKKGTIDFNGGIMSEFGGFLSVTLNENGSFTMELPEVYTGKAPRKVKKTFSYDHHAAKDMVLGIGTVASPEYIHQEAKLWLLIPVKSYDIVNQFLENKSSRYGRYFGNNFDNNFYAVQRNSTEKDISKNDCLLESFYSQNDINALLGEYHYDLYGLGGSDKFFLGPQSSNILGNDGKDIYFIPPSGGKTVIYNFALDEQKDTLYMNVSFKDLYCYRNDDDLVVNYCDSHVAVLKNWFVHGANAKYFQHIDIVTNDEIFISVTDTSIRNDQYQINCHPVAIDKSRSKTGVHLELQSSEFSQVTRAVGSNYSDVIVGNSQENILIGGIGNDSLSGGDGADVYVIRKGDGVDTIIHIASDSKKDTVMFGIDYIDISVEKQSHNLILFETNNPYNTRVIMKLWFLSEEYQQATFISKDYITFIVINAGNDKLKKSALTIDLSKSKHGVVLNLQKPDLGNGVDIDEQAMRGIKLIIDSPYNDHLVGNVRNNIMTCTSGSDYLQGNNGSDTYIVKQTCVHTEIFNEDVFKQYDLLLLNCSSSSITMSISGSDLVIQCSLEYKSLVVKVLNWFMSQVYQHLIVKTLDQWAFLPPESKENFTSHIEPYQIETTEDCGKQIRSYILNEPPFLQVQKFLAKSSNCRYNIVGNSLDNYIDPGPSDSYGYQTLTGGNGSDTYVFGHNYGVDNAIDNYATDEQYDHLLLNLVYENINIMQIYDDIVLSSLSPNNSVNVTLLNYLKGKVYQHLLIHTSSGVIFQVQIEQFAVVKEIVLVDYSNSSYSQIISPSTNPTLANVRAIFGSQTAVNSINGSNLTMKIVGGKKNDRIIGGSFILGEDIIGLDGDDYIDGQGGDDSIMGGDGQDILKGGEGNDIIYGGKGADTIDGGNGSDTIVFSGNGTIRSGVMINLQLGRGWYGDAEGDKYESVENILGSEYNDSLTGSDDDNVIRGYGGEDYIMPGGGFDVLQGGLGADIYDMKNAYGFKVVNNFATDKSLDTLFFYNATFNQMCYFFIEDSLHIVINFSNSSVTGAMRRVMLGEGYLEVKLLFWSTNETYQHIDLIFNDHQISSKNLPSENHQLEWISNELMNDTYVSFTSVIETSMILNLHFQSFNQTAPFPVNTELYCIHNNNNRTLMHNLNFTSGSTNGSVSIKIENLKSGTKQFFTILMISCGVKAAISSLHTATTLPNPPVELIVSTLIYDGFEIQWTPPDNTTDPNVFYYNYTIRYWLESSSEAVHTIEYNDGFPFRYTIVNLLPGELYSVSVASRIYGVNGRFSPPANVHAGHTTCLNFLNLPKHMHIERIEHNQNGLLQADLYCDENYLLSGDEHVICNQKPNEQPKCNIIHCDIPSVDYLNAFPAIKHDGLVADGEFLLWNCSKHYETQKGWHQFSSTCNEGEWSPLLKPCVLSPACPKYPPITNGRATPEFSYRDETISFSCEQHYTRTGPAEKVCKIQGKSEQYDTQSFKANSGDQLLQSSVAGLWERSDSLYHPNAPVNCVRYTCQKLLPQPHGTYVPSADRQFQSGDMVNLTCNNGYFVRDDYDHPEMETLTCFSSGTWSTKLCQPILRFVKQEHFFIKQISAYLEYTVPKWKKFKMLNSKYYQTACSVIGGNEYISSSGMKVVCSIDSVLDEHPPLANGSDNIFAGILTIIHHDDKGSKNKVCVSNENYVKDVCQELFGDMHHFPAASFINTDPFEATKEVYFDTSASQLGIRKNVQHCNKLLSCKATCQQLLLDGAINTCDKTLEGESCFFKCPPGSVLLGSHTRTCRANGTWSGDPNNCDASGWQTEINRYIEEYHSLHHSAIAEKIAHNLCKTYTDVTWVVIAFDPNEDNYKEFHSSNMNMDTYCKCNYYSLSVCVGRLTTPRVTSDSGNSMEYKLSKAYSPACNNYPKCKDAASGLDILLEPTLYSTAFHLQTQFRIDISSLFMFTEDSSYSAFAVRKDSHSGHTHSSKNKFIGTLPWDRRVATHVGSACTHVFAVILGQ